MTFRLLLVSERWPAVHYFGLRPLCLSAHTGHLCESLSNFLRNSPGQQYAPRQIRWQAGQQSRDAILPRMWLYSYSSSTWFMFYTWLTYYALRMHSISLYACLSTYFITIETFIGL